MTPNWIGLDPCHCTCCHEYTSFLVHMEEYAHQEMASQTCTCHEALAENGKNWSQIIAKNGNIWTCLKQIKLLPKMAKI